MRNPVEPLVDSPISETPFYLGECLVDPNTNRISRVATEIKVESKVMAVLLYLVNHRDQPVTREVLEQAIWGTTVVGYDALTRCIAQLRKALGDDVQQPRYIETISKKGYRLIAQVRPVAQTSSSNGTQMNTQRPLIAASILVLAVLVIFWQAFDWRTDSDNGRTQLQGLHSDQPTIIVLPFSFDDPEQAYFSEGVTADITTALSKLSGLMVIAPPASSNDHDQNSRTAGVRYALSGKIRRTADRIRVNVSLIDSHSDVVLWSEKYDRELVSVFDVQDDITRNIILALSIKLTDEENHRTARRYTTSIDAYDDFLRGQALYARYTLENNLVARTYYQQAIDRDPLFARAYSAMALTFVSEQRYGWSNNPDEAMMQALRLATKGKTLDPELPQAYWALAYVHLFKREYQEAAEAASQGIQLAPNFADTYLTLAMCRIHQGLPEQATALVRKAMLLNPEYPAAYLSVLGQSYFFSQQYAESIIALQDAIERNNQLLTPHVFLIVALGKQGQPDDASWAAEQLKSLDNDFNFEKIARLLPVDNQAMIDDMKNYLHRAGL